MKWLCHVASCFSLCLALICLDGWAVSVPAYLCLPPVDASGEGSLGLGQLSPSALEVDADQPDQSTSSEKELTNLWAQAASNDPQQEPAQPEQKQQTVQPQGSLCVTSNTNPLNICSYVASHFGFVFLFKLFCQKKKFNFF